MKFKVFLNEEETNKEIDKKEFEKSVTSRILSEIKKIFTLETDKLFSFLKGGWEDFIDLVKKANVEDKVLNVLNSLTKRNDTSLSQLNSELKEREKKLDSQVNEGLWKSTYRAIDSVNKKLFNFFFNLTKISTLIFFIFSGLTLLINKNRASNQNFKFEDASESLNYIISTVVKAVGYVAFIWIDKDKSN